MKDELSLPIDRRNLTLALAAAPWLFAGLAQGRSSSRQAATGLAMPSLKVQPFAMQQVRLLDGPCRDALNWNRRFLMQLDVDRLLHVFRVNAGLPSNATSLGGWEAPACELRGHFVGHYLSACALMFAGDGDAELKRHGDAVVAGMAVCQKALNQGGYLSAFQLSFFDRLDARKDVWAPFYTLHKIMAGLYDMHVLTGNQQALQVLLGMASWADAWCAAKPRPHMQDILNSEFGGMAEVFYNLAGLTKDVHWRNAGDRFAKDVFLVPLAEKRDALKDLHANTHIPQAIAVARRYEICDDDHDHGMADFFWNEVVEGHSYATGGTGNKEFWLTEAHQLGAEWGQANTHAECCCAYNMMKLSRHLFSWTGDAKYMEYYERLMFNHRLGTIEPETGRTMYYLSLTAGAWKMVGDDNATFWCCTGTGVEEYAKLADSIYFHGKNGLYVNQYIASTLNWPERKIAVEQHTAFPQESKTTLVIKAAPGGSWPIHLRIPAWTKAPSVSVNGQPLKAVIVPGGYLKIERLWKAGDSIVLDMPMPLHVAPFADHPDVQALMAGPIVLAGQFPLNGANNGPQNPTDHDKIAAMEKFPIAIPKLNLAGKSLADLAQPAGKPLTYTLAGQSEPITLKPLYQSWERYAVYWKTA